MIGAVGTRWFRQPDQFDWFSAYLDDRGLQSRWRLAMVVFTFTLALIPIALIWSPTGPNHPATIAASGVASLCGLAGGLLWLRHWPTRRGSMLYSVLATTAIAATCLSQSNPYAALMGCTCFAIIGGFIAYFHTAALLVVNAAVASICAVLAAGRLLADTGDIALTASAFLIVVGLNSGVPFGIHFLAHTLRRDLRTSGHDPLTELLNRRSFYHAAYELLMRHRGIADAHVTVAVIDLDDFKNLNDTAGHAAGDRALAAVGAALRKNCGDTAVIGRVGGEEFVIADCTGDPDPTATAERLRRAIAAIPLPITASFGITSTPLTDISTTNGRDLIDALICTADTAMYDAKRAGGNRVCHRPHRAA